MVRSGDPMTSRGAHFRQDNKKRNQNMMQARRAPPERMSWGRATPSWIECPIMAIREDREGDSVVFAERDRRSTIRYCACNPRPFWQVWDPQDGCSSSLWRPRHGRRVGLRSGRPSVRRLPLRPVPSWPRRRRSPSRREEGIDTILRIGRQTRRGRPRSSLKQHGGRPSGSWLGSSMTRPISIVPSRRGRDSRDETLYGRRSSTQSCGAVGPGRTRCQDPEPNTVRLSCEAASRCRCDNRLSDRLHGLLSGVAASCSFLRRRTHIPSIRAAFGPPFFHEETDRRRWFSAFAGQGPVPACRRSVRLSPGTGCGRIRGPSQSAAPTAGAWGG